MKLRYVLGSVVLLAEAPILAAFVAGWLLSAVVYAPSRALDGTPRGRARPGSLPELLRRRPPGGLSTRASAA